MKIPERCVTYIVLSILRLFIDSQWTGNGIDIPLNLNFTSQNIYSKLTLMCGLWICAGPLHTIYRVTSYLRLLALSIYRQLYNMSFLAPLISDNYGSLEQFELEHCPPHSPLKMCTEPEFLLCFRALNLTCRLLSHRSICRRRPCTCGPYNYHPGQLSLASPRSR